MTVRIAWVSSSRGVRPVDGFLALPRLDEPVGQIPGRRDKERA